VLSAIKRPVAYKAIGNLKPKHSPLLAQLTPPSREGTVERHLWQVGGGYDRNLDSSKAIHEALDYIHHNPVRRGLVPDARQWPWSSYREWYGPDGGPISVDRTVPTLMS
jgi:putative transposase